MPDGWNELRELLRILERKLGLIDDSTQSCCGITLAQCHALVEIGRAMNLSLNDLSLLLDLDKSTTSRTVDNLVRQKYVRRQTDPTNRRCVVIELTSAGQELFRGIENDMSHYYQTVMTHIPENKRAQVVESLQILVNAVEQVT